MDCPACHQTNIDQARFCAHCGALFPAAPAEADPLIGTVVGNRYRIVGVLGEGGMGRVYNGEQQMGTAVRKVAVKTLLAQYAKDPQVLARFMRECGTVSELEHPNTIRVYDFGQTGTGELYIAMELLNGTSLETTLEQGGALQPERVDRIIGQVCGSLQEAHEKGIVHRDLKPANIFLTKRAGEDDYVKVLDFGIAKKDDRNSKAEQKLTQQGTVLGTPPYMSPEQFTGKELDARSDIYSLGVMTYEMLTGRLPFEADTPWAWATQHMTAQPYPFEATQMGGSVPQKMKAAVMRALSKKPEERQQSVREYYEQLTLGAGPRLSVLGAMPEPSMPDASAGGTAMMPSRPGQTQLGAPLFAAGQPPMPAGRTVVDPGAPSTGVQAHVPAPTGSGQVFPAPAPSSSNKKGAGPMIAAVGVVALAAIIGGVVLMKKKGDDGSTAPIAMPTVSAAPVNVASDPVPTAHAGEEGDAAKKGVDPTKTAGTAKPPGGEKVEKVSEKAEQECRAAMNLALGGNTKLAVNHFPGCEGPGKAAAKNAIDASAKRAAAAKGCGAKKDAEAAASIGLPGAMNELRAKKCVL